MTTVSYKVALSFHHRVQKGYGAHPASYLMGTGVLIPAVKQPEREADHSPTSSANVRNSWGYTSNSQYVLTVWCLTKQEIRLHGAVLKHRDNFTSSLDRVS